MSVVAVVQSAPALPVDVLSGLQDIHLPSAISWWPLAPGWWGVLVFFCLMSAVLVYIYIRSQRRSSQELIVHQSMQLFYHLQRQSLTPKALIVALSELLRRTAISLYGRGVVANLAGDDWLQFLNQKGATKAFTKGVGRALAEQPYRPQVDYNRDALLQLTNAWLKQQLQLPVTKGKPHA
ncbi:MAG: DUF4381 domain-containing protein [Cocleimonas sp.]|nr:DUF4381 domain-containing protein [Cocleimonas sp.]